MNEVAKKQVVDLDGFRGFTDQIEGDEDGQSSSLFQGKRIKFTNDYNWMVNGVRLPDTFEAVVTEVLRCVLKWHPDKTQAPEVKVLGPGEKFPDIDTLNEKTSREEWVEGPDGKVRGPWQIQYLLRLIETTAAMERFSYPTSTIGGGIAVRELVERINWVRRFKGVNVYPVIGFADTFMNSRKFSGRQRPHLPVKRWVTLGGSDSEQPALPDHNTAKIIEEAPASTAKEAAREPVAMKTVSEPPVKKTVEDEIIF